MKSSYGLMALAIPMLVLACQEPPRRTKQPTQPVLRRATTAAQTPMAKKRVRQGPKAEWITAPNTVSDMATYVAEQLQVATKDKRTLVVYVGATWCEPCKRFHDSVSDGSLDDTFPTVRFLEFDADVHEEAIIKAGYASKYIPFFTLPDASGRPQGKHIMGAVKGEGAEPFIVPKLKALLSDRS